LTWRWQTNVWLALSAQGCGTVAPTSAWHALGAHATVEAHPHPYYEFRGWSGATQGDTNAPAMTVTMDRTRALSAAFGADETSQGVPYAWLEAHGLLTEGADPETAAAAVHPANGIAVWQEFYAGTDPNDASSVFAIVAMEREGATNRVVWTGGTNGSARPFAVMGTTNLTGGWLPLDGRVARSSSGTNVWSHVTEEGRMYYRIQIQTTDTE
jgi:hypothetical protein